MLCEQAPEQVNAKDPEVSGLGTDAVSDQSVQDGKTALHWAAEGRSVHMTELLLDAQAAVDCKDEVKHCAHGSGECNSVVGGAVWVQCFTMGCRNRLHRNRRAAFGCWSSGQHGEHTPSQQSVVQRCLAGWTKRSPHRSREKVVRNGPTASGSGYQCRRNQLGASMCCTWHRVLTEKNDCGARYRMV